MSPHHACFTLTDRCKIEMHIYLPSHQPAFASATLCCSIKLVSKWVDGFVWMGASSHLDLHIYSCTEVTEWWCGVAKYWVSLYICSQLCLRDEESVYLAWLPTEREGKITTTSLLSALPHSSHVISTWTTNESWSHLCFFNSHLSHLRKAASQLKRKRFVYLFHFSPCACRKEGLLCVHCTERKCQRGGGD